MDGGPVNKCESREQEVLNEYKKMISDHFVSLLLSRIFSHSKRSRHRQADTMKGARVREHPRESECVFERSGLCLALIVHETHLRTYNWWSIMPLGLCETCWQFTDKSGELHPMHLCKSAGERECFSVRWDTLIFNYAQDGAFKFSWQISERRGESEKDKWMRYVRWSTFFSAARSSGYRKSERPPPHKKKAQDTCISKRRTSSLHWKQTNCSRL